MMMCLNDLQQFSTKGYVIGYIIYLVQRRITTVETVEPVYIAKSVLPSGNCHFVNSFLFISQMANSLIWEMVGVRTQHGASKANQYQQAYSTLSNCQLSSFMVNPYYIGSDF